PIDSILGIRDLYIECVDRGREIHVWARPTKRLACIHCQRDTVRIKATHQRTLKHMRQGNQLMVVHLRVPFSCFWIYIAWNLMLTLEKRLVPIFVHGICTKCPFEFLFRTQVGLIWTRKKPMKSLA